MKNKEAAIRYRIIDCCLRNRQRPFPTLEMLIEECTNMLGKSFSDSTIQKDIYAMRFDMALGYEAPIKYHSHHKGYYYTDSNYSISKVPLTESDLDAIEFGAAILEQFKEVEILQQFSDAIDKIKNTLNIRRSLKSDEFDRFVQVEKPVAYSGSKNLGDLVGFIKERQVISFDYYSFEKDRSLNHTVHPYLLKEYHNRWYLIGMNEKYDDILTFGLERISNIMPVETTYKIFPGFDPENYFNNVIGITALKGQPEDITISVTPLEARYLESQPLHHSQCIDKDKKGNIHVHFKFIITHEFVMWLLSAGDQVKVEKPKWLVKRLTDLFKKCLEKY